MSEYLSELADLDMLATSSAYVAPRREKTENLPPFPGSSNKKVKKATTASPFAFRGTYPIGPRLDEVPPGHPLADADLIEDDRDIDTCGLFDEESPAANIATKLFGKIKEYSQLLIATLLGLTVFYRDWFLSCGAAVYEQIFAIAHWIVLLLGSSDAAYVAVVTAACAAAIVSVLLWAVKMAFRRVKYAVYARVGKTVSGYTGSFKRGAIQLACIAGSGIVIALGYKYAPRIYKFIISKWNLDGDNATSEEDIDEAAAEITNESRNEKRGNDAEHWLSALTAALAALSFFKGAKNMIWFTHLSRVVLNLINGTDQNRENHKAAHEFLSWIEKTDTFWYKWFSSRTERLRRTYDSLIDTVHLTERPDAVRANILFRHLLNGNATAKRDFLRLFESSYAEQDSELIHELYASGTTFPQRAFDYVTRNKYGVGAFIVICLGYGFYQWYQRNRETAADMFMTARGIVLPKSKELTNRVSNETYHADFEENRETVEEAIRKRAEEYAAWEERRREALDEILRLTGVSGGWGDFDVELDDEYYEQKAERALELADNWDKHEHNPSGYGRGESLVVSDYVRRPKNRVIPSDESVSMSRLNYAIAYEKAVCETLKHHIRRIKRAAAAKTSAPIATARRITREEVQAMPYVKIRRGAPVNDEAFIADSPVLPSPLPIVYPIRSVDHITGNEEFGTCCPIVLHGKRFLLTAKHVVGVDRHVSINYNGTLIPLTEAGRAAGTMDAIAYWWPATLPWPLHDNAKRQYRIPKTGENCFISLTSGVARVGRVTYVSDDPEDKFFKYTVSTAPGDSGALVYSATDGFRLIGIHKGNVDEHANVGHFCTNLSESFACLATLKAPPVSVLHVDVPAKSESFRAGSSDTQRTKKGGSTKEKNESAGGLAPQVPIASSSGSHE